MILKEKFAETILVPLENQGFYIDWDKVEKCEQIADDYAIEFGEWLAKWSNVGLENGNWIINFRLKVSTTKEALEIFKKEKGL